MTIKNVYSGIKTRLDTVTDLTGYSFQPASAVYPCAFPTLPEIDYHRAMQGGLRQLEIQVIVMLSGFEEQSRSENLFDHLEPSGAKSIFAAIEGDKTLAGAAQDIIVRQFQPFGLDELAAYKAIGGAFPMTVVLA